MFTRNIDTTKQKANPLRLNEVSRIVRETGAALTDWLRQRHESALRQLPSPARMRSANATPV